MRKLISLILTFSFLLTASGSDYLFALRVPAGIEGKDKTIKDRVPTIANNQLISDIKKGIFQKYLLTKSLSLIKSKDEYIRRGALLKLPVLIKVLLTSTGPKGMKILAESIIPQLEDVVNYPDSQTKKAVWITFGKITKILIDSGPEGIKVWEEQLFPFIKQSFSNEELGGEVWLAFTEVSEALLIIDPSGERFLEELLLLYRNALKNSSFNIQDYAWMDFGELLEILSKTGSEKTKLLKRMISTYKAMIHYSDISIRRNAWRHLPYVSKALITIDPSGKIFLEEYPLIYGRALKDSDREIHRAAWSEFPKVLQATNITNIERNKFQEAMVSMYKNVLVSSDHKIRLQALEKFPEVVKTLLILDPSGKIFLDEYLPLYSTLLQYPDTAICNETWKNFGKVLEILSNAGPEKIKLLEAVISVYKSLLNSPGENVRGEAYRYFAEFSQSLLIIDPSGKRFLEEYLPLYSKILKDLTISVTKYFPVSNEAWENFGGVLQTLLLIDPTGKKATNFLKEHLPKYQAAFTFEKSIELRTIAISSFATVAKVLITHYPDDEGIKILEEQFFPSYQAALMQNHTFILHYAWDSAAELSKLITTGRNGIELFEKLLPSLSESYSIYHRHVNIPVEPFISALISTGSEGVRLCQEWFPFQYERIANKSLPKEETVKEEKTEEKENLEEVEQALALLDQDKKTTQFVDFFRKSEALKMFTDRAENWLISDPSGNKFLARSLPYYNIAFMDQTANVRVTTAGNFLDLASSINFDSVFIDQTAEEIWKIMEDIPSPTDSEFLNSLIMFGILLLSQEQAKDSDPTPIWETVVKILGKIPYLEESVLKTELSSLLVEALSRKTAPMDEKIIGKAYQDYFKTNELPRQHSGPKDLLAQIILDYELIINNLPTEYSQRLRTMRRPPSYGALIPLIRQIGQEEKIFLEAIKGFTDWSKGISEKNASQYWGSVAKILEIAARDKEAFKSLYLWEQVCQILSIFEIPDTELKKAGGKVKFIQLKTAEIQNIIPQYVRNVFHFQVDKFNWVQPTEKEMNLINYVARNSTYSQENHPINQAFRPYFQKRLQGGTRTEALKS